MHSGGRSGSVKMADLVAAAAKGKPHLQRLLKSRDINTTDSENWTALHFAAHEGIVAAVKVLLAEGASVDAEMPAGWRPLHLAAQQGKKDVVELLLKAGADVNAGSTLDGRTALDRGSSPAQGGCGRERSRATIMLPTHPQRSTQRARSSTAGPALRWGRRRCSHQGTRQQLMR